MELATIAGLAGTVFSLIEKISAFVSTVRNARSDLDLVSQELVSLQICLKVLESDQRKGTILEKEMQHSLRQVLLNTEMCCKQIKAILAGTKNSRCGTSLRWVWSQRDQVTPLRSALAAHKSTLQLVLQMNTVAILVKEIRRIPRQQRSDSSSARRDDETHSTIQQMGQKINVIAERQENDSRVQQIQEALSELSSSIKSVTSQEGRLSDLLRQGCQTIHDKLATIEHVQGVSEARTRMNQIVQNSSLDPHHEGEQPGGHETELFEGHSFIDTELCPVCQRDMNHQDYAMTQIRLQQIQSDCRRQYNTELLGELQSLIEQRSRVQQTGKSPIASSSSDRVNNWIGANSAKMNSDDLADVLSEIVTLVSSWGSSDENISTDGSIGVKSDSTTKSSNTTTKIQRLQNKYDSAREEMQMLVKELAEFKRENAQLHSTHRQDIERLKTYPAQAQEALPQADTSQMENEGLRSGSIRQPKRHQEGANDYLDDQQNKLRYERELAAAKVRSRIDETTRLEREMQSTSTRAVEMKTTTRPDHINTDLLVPLMSGRRPKPNQIAHQLPIDELRRGACEVIARVQYHLIPKDIIDEVPYWSWSVIYFNKKPFFRWHISGMWKKPDTDQEPYAQNVCDPFPIVNQNRSKEDGTVLLLHVLSACLSMYRNDPYTKDTLCNELDREDICREFFSREVTIFKDKHFVKRSQPLTTYGESGVIDIGYIVDKDRYGYREDTISPQTPADFDAFWRGDRYSDHLLLGENPWPGGLLRPLE